MPSSPHTAGVEVARADPGLVADAVVQHLSTAAMSHCVHRYRASYAGRDHTRTEPSSAAEAMASPEGCAARHDTPSTCALTVFLSRTAPALLLWIVPSFCFGSRREAVAANCVSGAISESCTAQ